MKKTFLYSLLLTSDDDADLVKSEDKGDDILRLLPLILNSSTERTSGNRINGYFESIISRYNNVEFKVTFQTQTSKSYATSRVLDVI